VITTVKGDAAAAASYYREWVAVGKHEGLVVRSEQNITYKIIGRGGLPGRRQRDNADGRACLLIYERAVKTCDLGDDGQPCTQ